MSDTFYPLRFRPVYQSYLWGGDRIPRMYGRAGAPTVCAESWEVSTRPEGMSVAVNGPWAGRTLADLAAMHGAALLGTRASAGRFPLLIKLIDARERLSVQVHPSDETAARVGGEAKTEMWYLLDAAPDAQVFAGFHPGVTPAQFEAALAAQRLEDVLAALPVRPGEAIYMPGGRVHAVDAGCLILEVQQNSNTTYRLYDWGRVGADGRPRETHVAQAQRVLQWSDDPPARVTPGPSRRAPGAVVTPVLTCPYFCMEHVQPDGPWKLTGDPATFQALFVAAGGARVTGPSAAHGEHWPAGTSVLLPAALPPHTLLPDGPETRLLQITLPET